VKFRVDFYKKSFTKDGQEYRDWIKYETTKSKYPQKVAEEEIAQMIAQKWRGLKYRDLSYTIKPLEPWTKEELQKQLLY
jgi:hypothetical protein